MSSKTKGYTTTVVVAVVVIGSLLAGSAASLHSVGAKDPVRGQSRLGQVHGTVYAQLDANTSHKTFLPDISVLLKEKETGKETDVVVSADNGRYTISAP